MLLITMNINHIIAGSLQEPLYYNNPVSWRNVGQYIRFDNNIRFLEGTYNATKMPINEYAYTPIYISFLEETFMLQ